MMTEIFYSTEREEIVTLEFVKQCVCGELIKKGEKITGTEHYSVTCTFCRGN